MDPELIAYLDARFGGINERFRETHQQIQGLREETHQQIQGLREETRQQAQGLREETRQQIQGLREETRQQIQGLREETRQQVQGFREETAQQFEALREELRLTNVIVEKLGDNDRQLAEGIAAVDEKLAAFRDTAALEFSGIRSDLEMYYRDLNRRVHDLEIRTGQPGLQS